MRVLTPYFERLTERIKVLGGLFNSHLHLDRSGTYFETLKLIGGADGSSSSISLERKHALIPGIHSEKLYNPEALRTRFRHYLTLAAEVGTTRADSVVDVTADRVRLTAIEAALEVKEELNGRIDFRVGAYTPLGLVNSEPDRMDLLREAASLGDFVGGLPERDDRSNYPDHIGFRESCRRVLGLAMDQGKPVHLHVDQKNTADETGTRQIVEVLDELGMSQPFGEEPLVWLVHVISPSCYEEGEFQQLLEDLVRLNVGIICCPSAAISMRQLRPVCSPTHNSIARVLDFLAAGLHVRIGSDNLCDITSPGATIDLLDELFVLSNTLRFYDEEVLAKLGAGIRLAPSEVDLVVAHLADDRQAVDASCANLTRLNEPRTSI